MDLNECIFVGRLASDPKLKENPEDPTQTKCTFTLAVNRRFKKGKADFPRFVIWGEKKAKPFMEYCQKGKELTVVAEYQTEWYPPEKEGGEGVNFQIFRANQIIYGMDSQKILKEKEKARKAEMNRIVEMPKEELPSYNIVENFLSRWYKEAYDR